MAKSPSVTLIERDASTYSITSSDTVLAVVGYATKGPIGKATNVTSFKEFRSKFGYPTSIGYSSLAVGKAFNQGNKVVFYRVAETSGSAKATASAKIVKNDVSFLSGYTEFSRTSDILGGAPGYYNSEVYDFKVGTKMFYLKSPVSGRWSMSDILSQIQNQISATAGYQEFGAKTIDNPTAGYYSFKVGIDGNNSVASGELAVDITVDDTIETIRAKIASAISGGSRGYTKPLFHDGTNAITHLENDTVPATMVNGTYNFDIYTDGNNQNTKTVVINGIVASVTTYSEVAAKINAAFSNLNINAICVFNSAGFYFISKTRGALSGTAITLGVDKTSTGQGVPLFSVNAGDGIRVQNNGSSSAVTGSASTVPVYPTASYKCTVAIDPITLKIRITSATTGNASAVSITGGAIGDSLVDAIFMGGVKTARAGTVAANLTVEKNISTKKIKISAVNSVIPPVIEDNTENGNLRFVSFFGVDPATNGHEAKSVSSTDVIIITSKELGSSTKLISVTKSSKTNPITNAVDHRIDVYYDGDLVETFENISLTKTDSDYFVNTINDSVENGGSEWISVSAKDNDVDSIITFPDGTYSIGVADDSSDIAYTDSMSETDYASYDYIVGTDGIPESAGEGLFVEALNSSGDLGNKDSFDFHILITPDNIEEATQNAAIALAESRKDFVYLVDPPFGLTYSQVKSWHNGDGYGRDTAVSSSYAAIYWPWLKDYDSYSKKYVWCPPSVFMAEKLMEVDKTYAPWYAPAGDVRGKIIASDVETTPSFAEREELYGDYNCVNPIVNFVAKGLTVYGQKTALRENKATNRINVRRMVVKIKKLVKIALDGMLFEPNDSDSWQKASDLINAILEPIKQDNGLSAYKVIIDSSLNTADVVAQSMMKGIIKIVPTGTIEIVEISLNIYKTGASLD